MSKELYSQWLGSLSDSIGQTLTPDEGGLTVLETEGLKLYLQYDERADFIYLFAELGAPDRDTLPEMALKMLNANLFGMGTGGGTLALEEGTNEAVFSYTAQLPMEIARLTRILENTLDLALFWKEEIAAANQKAREARNSADTLRVPDFNLLRV